MPACVLLTAKDRLGRKQLASAGALNRTSTTSKGKTAAVCGVMQCQCIVESIFRRGSPSNRCHPTDTSGRQPLGCVSRCGFCILVLCCAHTDYVSISSIVVGQSIKCHCLRMRETKRERERKKESVSLTCGMLCWLYVVDTLAKSSPYVSSPQLSSVAYNKQR